MKLKIVKKYGKYAIKAKHGSYVVWDGKDGIHKKGDIVLHDTKEKAQDNADKWSKEIGLWRTGFESMGINADILKKRNKKIR